MKQIKFFALLVLIFCGLNLYAQEVETEDGAVVDIQEEPIQEIDSSFYGLDRDYVDFTSDEKKLDDWSLAIYGGMPILQGDDLITIGWDEVLWSYDVQAVLNKQITHAFGLGIQGNWGRTEQQRYLNSNHYRGHTEYWMISLLGDINFSQLLRRVDNKSRFAWALHGYGGIGTLQYKPFIRDMDSEFVQTGNYKYSGSIFLQGGGGLRYKLNQHLDIEGKVMYVYTGDEEFDGSGTPSDKATNMSPGNYPGLYNPNERPLYDVEEGRDDSFFTVSLGLVWKIGKHYEHLSWHDPLADIYPGLSKDDILAMGIGGGCQQGDGDDDAVCDDWDRQLDTPLGARVDGAGVALDTDMDGIIDLYDDCVTLPGPVENNGCPECKDAAALLSLAIQNVEFDLDKDVIRPQHYGELENAAGLLKYFGDRRFSVIGHTDSRASESYNMDLSMRRAESVKNFLVTNHGIPAEQLETMAKGESELIYPCDPATECEEWKNEANRRVVFEDLGNLPGVEGPCIYIYSPEDIEKKPYSLQNPADVNSTETTEAVEESAE